MMMMFLEGMTEFQHREYKESFQLFVRAAEKDRRSGVRERIGGEE
jgi:hypothetical protein